MVWARRNLEGHHQDTPENPKNVLDTDGMEAQKQTWIFLFSPSVLCNAHMAMVCGERRKISYPKGLQGKRAPHTRNQILAPARENRGNAKGTGQKVSPSHKQHDIHII